MITAFELSTLSVMSEKNGHRVNMVNWMKIFRVTHFLVLLLGLGVKAFY